MHQLRRTRLLVAVPTALLLSVAAVGCGNLIEDAAKDRAEDALASEGISADLDDPSNIEVEGTDGGFTTGKLPKTFPDEVPVVDGEIILGNFTKSPDTWNVTIKVGEARGDKAAAYSTAEETLLDGGLENVTPQADNGTAIFGDYESDGYLVNLAVTDSNGIVVNYTVTPK